MKYTVGELIKVLNNFPENIPIVEEIALMWEYPDELKEDREVHNTDEFASLTMNHATCLHLYNGDWNKGTVDYVKKTHLKPKPVRDKNLRHIEPFW